MHAIMIKDVCAVAVKSKSHKPTCMIDMQFAEKNEITQAYLFVALEN